MADAPDKDQKTQDPTDKRLADTRRKGDVAMAPEVRQAAMFAAALVVTGGLGADASYRLGIIAASLWDRADDIRINPHGAQAFATDLLGQVVLALLPLLAALFGFALLGGLLQGRPTLAWARLKPKWSKFSPIAGFKRMFGKQALVEFAKTLAKMVVVGGIAAAVAWPKAISIDQLVGAEPLAIGAASLAIVHAILVPVALLIGALAAFDMLWQRRSFLQRMRMSLQEVKDEHKESEGDPKIKARIRGIQMQRAKRRMMAAVPKASVIITNPTHFAVALQYDHGAPGPPLVVAKGVDAVALRIREIAGEAGVPIVENPPLARALYASADIEQPIPVEHYAAVAEIISYVLRLAKRRG